MRGGDGDAGERVPAASIPSRFWMVPKLTSRPPDTLLRSSISSGAVAMMGEAPSASVALADCVVTTLFVICQGQVKIIDVRR